MNNPIITIAFENGSTKKVQFSWLQKFINFCSESNISAITENGVYTNAARLEMEFFNQVR